MELSLNLEFTYSQIIDAASDIENKYKIIWAFPGGKIENIVLLSPPYSIKFLRLSEYSSPTV
jgi:hypothetical protein